MGEEQRAVTLYESTNVSVGMSYAYTGASPQIACGKGRETNERAQAGAVPFVGEMRCEPAVSLIGMKALYLQEHAQPGSKRAPPQEGGGTATLPTTAPSRPLLPRANGRRPTRACQPAPRQATTSAAPSTLGVRASKRQPVV